MTTTSNNTTEAIFKIASKHPSIKRIGIFGSYARGDSKLDSDIDLLYDYDDSNNTMLDDAISCLGDIQKLLDIPIDFIAYEDIFKINNDYDVSFKQTVLNEVIWIYEKLK